MRLLNMILLLLGLKVLGNTCMAKILYFCKPLLKIS